MTVLAKRQLGGGALVRDRMSIPVIRVRAAESISRVTRLLEKRKISGVPVVEGSELIGIISMTDILRDGKVRTHTQGCSSSSGKRTARDIMTAPVIVTHPEATIDEAAWRMVAGRIHRLVVVNASSLTTQSGSSSGCGVVGMLTVRDVLEELVSRRVSIPVHDIMSSPTGSIGIRDSVEEAIDNLVATDIHGLVVVDGLTPVGLFGQQQAIAARKLSKHRRRDCMVENLMSFDAICLESSTPVWRAAAYAMHTNVRRLFICDERQQLVGMASLFDLVKALVDNNASFTSSKCVVPMLQNAG